MEENISDEKLKELPEKTVSKFELLTDDRRVESAKENFLSFMEAVWPTVANYYFEVEKEILTSIQEGSPKKVKFLEDKENELIQKKNSISYLSQRVQGQHSLQPQLSLTEENSSTSSTISVYDCSAALKAQKKSQVPVPPKQTKSRKKIVETKDEDGNIVWDVVEAISCPTFPSTEDETRVENSAPIIVHHDPCLLYTDSPDSIPLDIRQAIVDAEAQVRQALSTCFGKISKSFTNSYPKIRLMINKAYPQIRHTVSCSYPNIQYTINNSYDKVQGTVRSTYPKIRKTVTGSYPKRQTVSACYRRVRQSQMKIPNAKSDKSQPLNKLADANFDLTSRLSAANAEISQALHNTSKKVSIALGTANLEILQALKNASNKVSKSLIKANSEILEALALANDDLRKNLAMICNEAARALDSIKIQLSKVILDLHPKVWQVLLKSYENLQQALDHSHVEILETLAIVSSEVCEQISYAHGKYSEAKVAVNYELSLALAKANSQVLQVLIAANSKVSDVLDRNTEKVTQITSSIKLGSNLELLESRVWRVIEKGEADVWKTSENASFTIESAVESTDSRLWKVADEADNNLRKSVQGVESKLVASIGSSEWKLKSCAERLETLVTECVGRFVDTAWQSVSCYISECGMGRFSETKLQDGSHSSEVNLPTAHSTSSIKILLGCNKNGYYVGFPDSEDDEDFDPSALLRLKSSEFELEGDSAEQQVLKDDVVGDGPEQGDGAAVDGGNRITDISTVAPYRVSPGTDIAALNSCNENLDDAIEKEIEPADVDASTSSESSNYTISQKVIEEVEKFETLSQSTVATDAGSATTNECLLNGGSIEPSDELVQPQTITDTDFDPDRRNVSPPSSEHVGQQANECEDLRNDLEDKPTSPAQMSFVSKFDEESLGKFAFCPGSLPEEEVNTDSRIIGDKMSETDEKKQTDELSSPEEPPSALMEACCCPRAPPMEQLSASFHANLQKLQLQLSANSGSNDNSSSEIKQLLQECKSAWNMITTLYLSSNHFQEAVEKSIVFPDNGHGNNDETPETHTATENDETPQPSISASSLPKHNWGKDIVFGHIAWEAVESSQENLLKDLDEQESLESLNELTIHESMDIMNQLPQQDSVEAKNEDLQKDSLETDPLEILNTPLEQEFAETREDSSSTEPLEIHPDEFNPEALETLSDHSNPESLEILNDLSNYSSTTSIASETPLILPNSAPSDSSRDSTLQNHIAAETTPPKQDPSAMLETTPPGSPAIKVKPPTGENSDSEEASSSSRTASPQPSIITLPFTDDEQQVDLCPQTSLEDASLVSDNPSYQSENIKELISNFVELSTILFYQASLQIQEDPHPEQFPQSQPPLQPLMVAERRPLHPLQPPLSSPPLKPSLQIQKLGPRTASSKKPPFKPKRLPANANATYPLNLSRKLFRFHYLIPNRSKFTSFKFRLKHIFRLPCCQNSFHRDSPFKVHPIKRVQKHTNFQQ